jgi:putative ABC transport system substrate-binding protein
MKRRTFIAGLGSTAAWPVVAWAQQPIRRIGVLTNLASDDPDSLTRIGAFLQSLQELGWTDGRNVRIDYRWSAGDPERNKKYAAELIALAPAVIMATGLPAVEPLIQASRTVPIVFVQVPDPVGAGVVESLAQPGGNATGFTNLEYGQSTKVTSLGIPRSRGRRATLSGPIASKRQPAKEPALMGSTGLSSLQTGFTTTRR